MTLLGEDSPFQLRGSSLSVHGRALYYDTELPYLSRVLQRLRGLLILIVMLCSLFQIQLGSTSPEILSVSGDY